MGIDKGNRAPISAVASCSFRSFRKAEVFGAVPYRFRHFVLVERPDGRRQLIDSHLSGKNSRDVPGENPFPFLLEFFHRHSHERSRGNFGVSPSLRSHSCLPSVVEGACYERIRYGRLQGRRRLSGLLSRNHVLVGHSGRTVTVNPTDTDLHGRKFFQYLEFGH